MQINIPTHINSMSLKKLTSYANIMKSIMDVENDFEKLDRFELIDDLCVIAFGTSKMRDVLTAESLDKIFLAVIASMNPVFDSYIEQTKKVKFQDSFKVTTIEGGRSKTKKYNINQNPGQLPAELWGAILTKADQLKSDAPVFSEILNIPFVLSRIAWTTKEGMYSKDMAGDTVINRQAIAEKENDFMDANALDAVRSYVFFLITQGVYLTAPSFLYSKKKLTTRILNLQRSVLSSVKDGVGLAGLKTLLQKETINFSSQN